MFFKYELGIDGNKERIQNEEIFKIINFSNPMIFVLKNRNFSLKKQVFLFCLGKASFR